MPHETVDLLIRALPAAPVLIVNTAAQLVGRTFQAANEGVERLVRVGVLVPTREARRNKAFEAAGLLDALTGFERALASPTGDTRDSPPTRHIPRRPSRPKPPTA